MKNILTLFLLCCCGVVFGQNYHIGDVYTAPDGSKGIVYYLHPDGSGGWVVALNDASTSCVWGDAVDVPGLANRTYTSYGVYQLFMNDTAGYAHTQTIRNYQNNNTYAAGIVDFDHGWYLPSLAQIRMLYSQLPFISDAIVEAGGTDLTTGDYWSSVEQNASNAWAVYFNYGNFINKSKSTAGCVRAVRSFSYGNEPVQISYLWSTGDTTPSITVTPTRTTTYTVTVSTPGGCADTVEHTIVVGASSNEEISQTACDSYEWNGHTYTQSGDYTFVYPMPGGCDSVVILHLTVDHTPQVTISVSADSICEGNEVELQASAASSIPISYLQPVAIGDILCTDNSIVKPSSWPVAGKTAMGVVFYVDNTGEHGWAMNLNNENSDNTMRWGGSGTDIVTLNNFSLGNNALSDLDGYGNTQKIRAAGDAATYPSAWAMDFENGWYLPAAGQLRCIYPQLPTLNASLQIVGGLSFPMNSIWGYWSSTEADNSRAWHLDENGQITSYTKNMTYRVRSVRNF